MATHYSGDFAPPPPRLIDGSLADPARAMIGPRRDALLFWGSPVVALLLVDLWLVAASVVSSATGAAMVLAMGVFVSLLTWAHLIAVAPRAYLNRDVFSAHRMRLIVAPIVLVAALLLSPTALAIGIVVSVFWDVHHSAMQTFGFGRIYDMKAGKPADLLRWADLRLNWALYVGPLAAGASLPSHIDKFSRFDGTTLHELASLPGIFQTEQTEIHIIALAFYAYALAWTGVDYARAIRAGYRPSAHKVATFAVAGLVSLIAWGFSSPLVALTAINLYHAVQYFALVWLKEGATMTALVPPAGKSRRRVSIIAAVAFAAICTLFAFAYQAASAAPLRFLLAPFIACSLLHFWYDGFVWSVRKRQV